MSRSYSSIEQSNLRLKSRLPERVGALASWHMAQLNSADEREAFCRSLLRLLALLYAEGRGLLPLQPDRHLSLRTLVQHIAEHAGPDPAHVPQRLHQAYSSGGAHLHRRLDRILHHSKHATPGRLLRENKLPPMSDADLALIIDTLARDKGKRETLAFIDYGQLDVRQLGAVYEALLDGRSTHLSSGINDRKSRGAYFTPAPIVEHIIAHTLGPVLEERLETLRRCFRRASSHDDRLVDEFFRFRVLDPAMGAGYFLIAAVDHLTGRMLQFLQGYPHNPLFSQLRKRYGARPRAPLQQLLRWRILQSCIYGMDIDPLAVEVARLSLHLQCSWPALTAPDLGDHLRCGNALSPAAFSAQDTFDVVIGNPPHGAVLDAETLALARSVLPLMASNSDTAVGFLQKALQLTSPAGRLGYILPKPLTYSYAWRQVRAALKNRLHVLQDISRAWPDVRLEQVIVVAGSQPTGSEHYMASVLRGDDTVCLQPMAYTWADRFATLPCALNADELALLRKLHLSVETVGDLCRTYRGVPLQRRLRLAGRIPVVGGRDLTRWQIRSYSGYVNECADAAAFKGPKLVFQNIIAHIGRPTPHIRLIGAYDRTGAVTLDTVNNLVARDRHVNLWGVLALLHSDLINWFVHAVIYNKAIRTMHFDQYFLNKIMLPPDAGKLLTALAPLARAASKQQDVMREINAMVNRAYGLSRAVFPPAGRACVSGGVSAARRE